MTIDLHVHSSVSDGSMAPADLVALAARKGLLAIALTDHDTVNGIDAAVSAGRSYGVEIVTGVELSVRYHDSSVHLLGYLFDHNNRILLNALGRLQEGRVKRNKEIISRLKNHGVDIHYTDLKEIAGPGECGRPHIAKLLIQKNVVKSMDEAFEKFLKQGTPTYVSRFIYEAWEAIDILKSAGGLAVLAHPPTPGHDGGSIGDNLEDL
ncbi:MAG: PHP domain-containing protein, partial [Desulforhopalus sp.]